MATPHILPSSKRWLCASSETNATHSQDAVRPVSSGGSISGCEVTANSKQQQGNLRLCCCHLFCCDPNINDKRDITMFNYVYVQNHKNIDGQGWFPQVDTHSVVSLLGTLSLIQQSCIRSSTFRCFYYFEIDAHYISLLLFLKNPDSEILVKKVCLCSWYIVIRFLYLWNINICLSVVWALF